MSIQRYAPTRYSRIYEACQGGLIKYADHKKVCKEFGKMIQSLKDNDADHKAALAEKEKHLRLANGMMKQAATHAAEVMIKLHEREAELEKDREIAALKSGIRVVKQGDKT